MEQQPRYKIKLQGVIKFDPPELTNKHKKQGQWKKYAIVQFRGDICPYYAWFLKKRYSMSLFMPMRGPHVSFINDRGSDLHSWEKVKRKYHNKRIEVEFDLTPDSDKKHWWLVVTDRELLHGIRSEMGLGRPFAGLHMSLGRISDVPHKEEHARYIQRIHKNLYRNV